MDYIYGRNACISSLKGERKPSKVLMINNLKGSEIDSLCKKNKVNVEFVDAKLLDKITSNKNHQGVLGYVEEFKYAELDPLLSKIDSKKNPLLLILDGIEDPVNFGSIIRTASCFGVDGIIILKDRQVQVTPVVSKVSTGATEFVPIVRVTNLNVTIEKLKKDGYWIVATDGSGDRYYDEVDYNGKIAVIIGSEGRGASKLVLKNSDFVVRIPISGPITSLNASIANAIVLAQIEKYRREHK